MATIKSELRWNDTGIDITKGTQYHYKATGIWKDGYLKPCNATGFHNLILDLFNWTKRRQSAKWFQLIGVVDKNPAYTIILSTEGQFIAPATGRLWAYANDAEFAYFNNSGSIELHIYQE